ncbi:protein AIM2 [Ascoidea rubescens DSM 1968]|uniref:Dienelactone hydrolase n=1 Tax=Ascoidea rubescens DSM 1968 TaxID=1344418 RepID=A0A1D2VNM7_9ASCO|nr:dienelactone hydrolase [Ascoidea rubescens DSM 1968]ODV63194.1 dienelactone hydrolase [Ascoidea rubescens DSM 1968]
MSAYDCCFKTIFHSGEPKGKHTDFLGYDTYQTGDKNSSKIIVILTDVFGHRYNNVLLIADKLAEAGYYVVIPDYLEGGNVTFSQNDPQYAAKIQKWLDYHNLEKTKPIVDDFFKKLKDSAKYKFIGVTGYCFGGRYAIQQISDTGYADAAAVAHPSLVQIEEIQSVSKPLLISAAEIDKTFTIELRHQSEKVLAEKGAIYQIDLFGGVVHGFAVRGDLSDARIQYSMNRVISDQIYWFNFYS